jgi:hypothetical protein
MQRSGRKVGRVESSPEILPPSQPSRTLCNRRPHGGFPLSPAADIAWGRRDSGPPAHRQVTSPSLTRACCHQSAFPRIMTRLIIGPAITGRGSYGVKLGVVTWTRTTRHGLVRSEGACRRQAPAVLISEATGDYELATYVQRPNRSGTSSGPAEESNLPSADRSRGPPATIHGE